MKSAETTDWSTANQQYIMTALNVVREELETYRASLTTGLKHDKLQEQQTNNARKELERVRLAMPSLPALDRLAEILGLSSFEQDLLLLCAGVELDAEFTQLIASLQNGASAVLPSFSLGLAVLPDSHWSALSPNSALRYWRLLHLQDAALLTRSPLKIDEQVLHYIAGIQLVDERLREIVELVSTTIGLAPSQHTAVDQIVGTYAANSPGESLPVMQLSGDDSADKEAVAVSACTRIGLTLFTIPLYSLPNTTRELTELSRLWNREAALNAYALYLDCTGPDAPDPLRGQTLVSFVESLQSLVFISTDQWEPRLKRPKTRILVHKPTPVEQLTIWENQLGEASPSKSKLKKLVAQFNLSANTIHTASAELMVQATPPKDHRQAGRYDEKQLWKICCEQTRPHIDALAQRIEPIATWNDIVLPETQKNTLRELTMQVRQRLKVYDDWGFGAKSSRGLGITALFSGESGTGKTMASEVLANELHLDLYRIDLSQVVNKYIGETEKNLKRIFDAAEAGGAILLFDEADALFGKRSDVKDSHDRYSNIEVSYLLQRMEAYRGLAILTTNMKGALDKAFFRRIRFVVQFPYPDAQQRAEIWRRVFPRNMPKKNIDLEKLSRLNIPGGNIRNIALNAAFIAASEGKSVHMSHIARAARGEYTKLEKTLSSTEIGGW